MLTQISVPTLGYGIEVLKESGYDDADRRLLIVLETVPTEDLKAQALNSSTWASLLKLVRRQAKAHGVDDAKISIINFNDKRTKGIPAAAAAEAVAECRTRALKLVKKFRPTHLLFSGNINVMYPDLGARPEKNGWTWKVDQMVVGQAPDYAKIRESDSAANLIYLWVRNLMAVLAGHCLYDLSRTKARPVLVRTIEQLEKVLLLCSASADVAVDTETRNLSVLNNSLYTIQLACSERPSVGFVIPVDHPHEDNPWTDDQRKTVKRLLRQFFLDADPQLLTFNGTFDLRIVRKQLKINVLRQTVWEIMAGEHLLDENMSGTPEIGYRSQGLAAVFCSYGNDFYYRSDTSFSKDDRGNIARTSPLDKGFLNYAATDVVSLLAIKGAQIKRAAAQPVENYVPQFVRHMKYQMSDTVHVLSHLKEHGSLLDRKYLRRLLKPDSELDKVLVGLEKELMAYPEVIEANKQLCAKLGFKSTSLFGSSSTWVFSFNKAEHKQLLFFDVCGLEPLAYTPSGDPQVDKSFINHYRSRSFLVDKFGEYVEALKLRSTYIAGWEKRLSQDPDGSIDNCMRADYSFHVVDSGRLNSANPNLQNIPARGKLAKLIKEAFIAPAHHMLIRFDFSAHEVRGWSIAAVDTVLAQAFIVGQQLRRKFIKASAHLKPGDPRLVKLLDKIAKEGDLHIQNCFRFWGKWVDKKDPLRDAVKAVVFGLIYGKGARTLGQDMKKTELDKLKAEIRALVIKGESAADAIERYNELLEADWSDRAEEVIDKLYTEFQAGKAWLDMMSKNAETKGFAFSPIGRLRHMFSVFFGDKGLTSRQVRRGTNAPIQGFASEVSVKASRMMIVDYYDLAVKYKESQQLQFSRIVHDASYFAVPFSMVLPFIHVLQYNATYGVAEAYKKQFDFEFTVAPEIEIEIGVKDTKTIKWSWSLPDLPKILRTAVDQGLELGIYDEPAEEIMAKIMKPWTNKASRAMLNSKYPLLGVDLEQEIAELVS